MQTSINERLKFLLGHFNLSARKFSRAIGVPENTTQNYLPPKVTDPGSRYLERLLLHFEDVNAHWLLTGDGDAFDTDAAEPGAVYVKSKKNSGNVLGTNHGTISQTVGMNSQSEALLKLENQHLRSQLDDKNKIIELMERQLQQSQTQSGK